MVATDVPIWQLALSVVLLILTFFGTLWVAAKIYRVGILMYGKKPKFKDLIKWIRLAK
jgi:ABC-2 type transport system permease protein